MPAAALTALLSCLIDQDAAHGLSGGGEEVSTAVPVLGLLDVHQAEVRFVDQLGVYERQLCWAHLVRDFQAMVDRGGPGVPIGEELLAFAEDLFHWWYRVRDGTLTRTTLRTYIAQQRHWLRELLQRGSVCGCAKTAAVCRELQALEPALWTFARVPGVEPTNNAAERALRPAVLWRRRSFGCHSDAGCRFVERILTAVQTLRKQQRDVLDYLVQTITAHRHGLATPELVSAG